MNDASHTLAWLLGILMGAGAMHFWSWYYARKIEALVPGGLKAWDGYKLTVDHASATGRIVTEAATNEAQVPG